MSETWMLTPTVHADRMNLFCLNEGHERHVCTLVAGSRRKLEQFRNDAALIAVAPELYALVRDAVSDGGAANPGWLDLARQALAKASPPITTGN